MVAVFLSAVSKEFHETDPHQPTAFNSYRYVLERSLSCAGFRAIVQETLPQGFGDLLGTIDDEVGKSDVVVHLIGEMAGASPDAAPLRRLLQKYKDRLLTDEPELAAAIGDRQGISFTQLEFYLAEPLMRRALAIHEQSFGAEHPNVARDLNNLAQLLQNTNRLAEAEPLMRQHVVIFHKFGVRTGHQHPHMQAALVNYRGVLRALQLPDDEIGQRVKNATADTGPLKPMVPEVARLLGPIPVGEQKE